MTKKICVLFTIILMSIAGYCQPAPQNWNWYFGNHAALNFSSGSPVAVAGSAMDAEEGSASISDSNGNLLFYTNGISVWNRNNIQMPNGSGLLGDNSSTQSALIIPHPDSTNIYYIFTSAIGGNPNGYNYSEVDMTLDSARGDITVKNIHLFDSSSEKLTAIKNCNNNDYWVLCHGYNNNSFYAYPVTGTGVGIPIITNIGANYSNDKGYMKASPNCKKIGANLWGSSKAEIYDFDNSTGVLSNTISLPLPTNSEPYGISFSPNSMVLYLDFWYSNDGYIYQYDISSNNQSLINASLTVLGPYFDLFGALQLASNNKIYFDTQYGNFIGIINNPNILGVGCNIGGGVSATTVWGLPNFIDAYNVPPSPSTFIIIDTTTCLSSLQLNATSISSSYLWSNGTTTQSIFVSNSGTYWVQIQVLYGCNLNVLQTDTFHINISPPFNVNLGPNISFCQGDSSILNAGSFAQYQWSTGSSTQTISVSTSGTYIVTVTNNNGCTRTASKTVTVNPNPNPYIIGDSSFCSGNSTMLNAGSYNQYHWSTNVGTPYITVTASGTYIVTVTDTNGCTGTASQTVSVNPSPNPSILPNGPTTFCQGGSVSLDAGSYSSYLWSNSLTTQAINATASGNYIVTVSNSSSCTGTASQAVTVIANPNPTILPASPINFCEGENIQLEASNGILYNWSTGATTQSIITAQSGDYIVTVTYGVNCSNTSAPTQVTVHPIPIATITAIPDNIDFCEGDSINLITNSTTSPLHYSWITTATTQSIEATIGGTFIVTITDTNNCHSTSSITLTSYLYPVANFTYTMFLNTTTFTNTSTNGMDYQWYFGDGNVSTLMNPNHTYAHDSTYTITLIVSNPCGTDTIRQTITLTGINEINNNSGFTLSPNPFTTTTALTLQGAYHNPSLFIYNLIGQEVRNIPIGTNQQIIIPRNNLPAGMYFYKVMDENKEVIGIGKMVVE